MIYFLVVIIVVLAVALGVVGTLLFITGTTPEKEKSFIRPNKTEPTGHKEFSNFLNYDGTKQE